MGFLHLASVGDWELLGARVLTPVVSYGLVASLGMIRACARPNTNGMSSLVMPLTPRTVRRHRAASQCLLKIDVKTSNWRFWSAKPLKTLIFRVCTVLDRISRLFKVVQCPLGTCCIRHASRAGYHRIRRRLWPDRLRGAPRIYSCTNSLKFFKIQNFVFWAPDCESGWKMHTGIHSGNVLRELSGQISIWTSKNLFSLKFFKISLKF